MNDSKVKTNRRDHAAPTIADVAAEAGVSPMTVSRVINRAPSVRPNTRKKVEAVIAKLNYSPNASAQQLAGARPIHMGLIYDNPSATFLSEFLIGALDQASALNAQLTIEQALTPRNAVSTAEGLIERGVDGVILPPPLSDAVNVLEYLERAKVPAVVAASSRLKKRLSAVSIDDEQAAYEMTQHILSLGHRRIGFIAGNPDQMASQLRLFGYKKALNEAGIKLNQNLLAQGLFSYQSGLEAAEQLLRLKNKPTAIFASNDDMAAATLAVAHKLSVSVPRELTVCGFDDSLLATTVWPELTTIHQPIMEMSRQAVAMLVEKIQTQRSGKPVKSQHVLLNFSLIKRESTAPLK